MKPKHKLRMRKRVVSIRVGSKGGELLGVQILRAQGGCLARESKKSVWGCCGVIFSLGAIGRRSKVVEIREMEGRVI